MKMIRLHALTVLSAFVICGPGVAAGFLAGTIRIL